MKKIISLVLSLIIAFSCLSVSEAVYANSNPTVESALGTLFTKQGFIPWQASAVQYNCFGFISKICEKLYGVSYYYEQQNGNYSFNHTTDYFTVSESVYPYSADLNVRKQYAQQIKDWIFANAAVGDIMQYGSADAAYSKKHTVLITHLDEAMIQVVHANYETPGIPASACRVDTIYWDSFVSNPNANATSNGTITSLNLLLGSGLKMTQGFGISLNRYSFLESKYTLQSLSSTTCSIKKTERMSTTSIKVVWNTVSGATAYGLEYREINSNSWLSASDCITADNYTVGNLTTGLTYCFRVRALVNGAWCDYSTEYTKSCLPPKPGKVTVAYGEQGISLSWAKRSDITGCVVYRSLNKDDGYEAVADLNVKNVSSYTDSSVNVNTTYYYKIQRYVISNNSRVDGEPSSAASAQLQLYAPTDIKAYNAGRDSIKLSWTPAQNAKGYTIACFSKKANDIRYIDVTDTSCVVNDLVCGRKYYFTVASRSSFGVSGASDTVSLKVKPKKVSISTSCASSKARVTFKKTEDVDGYVIYRAYSRNGKYKAVKTIKSKKAKVSFVDKKTYKGNRYYYKVKSYISKNGKRYMSDASAVKSVKIK